MTRLAKSRILLLLQCLLIFCLSSISDFRPVNEFMPWTEYVSDIAAHFVLYFILACAAIYDFRVEPSRILSSKPAVAAIAFTTLYGVSDEFHQMLTPGRNFEIKDMVVNFSSAVVAVFFFQLIFRKKER